MPFAILQIVGALALLSAPLGVGGESTTKGISQEVRWAAADPSACVILEEQDLEFALPARDWREPFERYQVSVREAFGPISVAIAAIKEKNQGLRDELVDAVYRGSRQQLWDRLDEAQRGLLEVLHATPSERALLIRHALWRDMLHEEGSPTGLDSAMLLLTKGIPESAALKKALDAKEETALALALALEDFNSVAGPLREANLQMDRAAVVQVDKGVNDQSRKRSAAARAESWRTLSDGFLERVTAMARQDGHVEEVLRWRARAFRIRAPRLIAPEDIVMVIESSGAKAQLADPVTYDPWLLQALERRDAAMAALRTAWGTCARTLTVEGPNAPNADRVVRDFSEAVRRWEKFERGLASEAKSQFLEAACDGARSIDGYLAGYDRLAQHYWRDVLDFWTYFVADHKPDAKAP